MVRLSVVIVNYNGGAMTQACLDALARQTFRDFEVVLVDNASTDGSREILARIPGITFLPLPENTGFAGGNNAGAKAAKGEWLVLLNNDAFPDPDWLACLLRAAEKYPNFDFFTSRQYCHNEPHLLDGTGDCLATNGRAWRRDYRVPAVKGTNATGEVFGACGAGVMFRKTDFDAAGGFDESFFCHFEDVDLSFRLRLMDKRCLYVHDAVIYHIGSATVGGERSDFALYQGMRNSVWCYVKCMPGPMLRKHAPVFLWKHTLDLGHALLAGKGRVAFRAKWDALKGLPAVLKKRRAVQGTMLAETDEIARLILPDPGIAREEADA